MEYQRAIDCLVGHANLPIRTEWGASDLANSFVYSLFKIDLNKSMACDLESYCNSILECLDVINAELNGTKPSENATPSRPVDRELVLAMSSILDAGWSYHLIWTKRGYFTQDTLDRLAQMLWTVSCAWNLVLHGDIDLLREYIIYEYAVLGLGPITVLSNRTGDGDGTDSGAAE